MRASAADRIPVVAYGLGLVAAGRLLGSEAHPLVAAMVPASVILLGLVLPVAPASLRRSLFMLAGGTFILGASSGALFAAGGTHTFGSPRWLMVLVPALYLLYTAAGVDYPSSPRDPATRSAAFADQLLVSGILVWSAAIAVLAADALTSAPPTPNDTAWLVAAGAGLVGSGTFGRRVSRRRRPAVGVRAAAARRVA